MIAITSSANMSYQYPPPPDDDSSPQSTTDRPFFPPVISIEQPQLQQMDGRESTSPTERGNGSKRAASSPNMRNGQSAADATLAAAAEKRRNKLGYHRTSVACGHCRRRKIRCVLAPGDIDNRCENCIRLKKDCNFYPVDAVPPPMGGGRSPRGAMNGGKDVGRPLSGAPASHIYASSNPNREPLPLAYTLTAKYNSVPLPSNTPPGRPYLDGPPRTVTPMYEPSHEYPSASSNAWMHGDRASAPRPNDASYWSMNPSQEPPVTPGNFGAFPQDMRGLSHQQSWPAGPESGMPENPDYAVMGRSVPYPSHPGLNNTPSSFNQFSPSGQTLGRDGLAPRNVGQPVASYLRGSDNSPMSSSANDITNGEHTSIPGPLQLPSFPSVHQGGFSGQPQGLGNSSYGKPLPSNTESYGGSWGYPATSGLPPKAPGPQEGSQQYGAGGPYGSGIYYDDGPPGMGPR